MSIAGLIGKEEATHKLLNVEIAAMHLGILLKVRNNNAVEKNAEQCL